MIGFSIVIADEDDGVAIFVGVRGVQEQAYSNNIVRPIRCQILIWSKFAPVLIGHWKPNASSLLVFRHDLGHVCLYLIDPLKR